MSKPNEPLDEASMRVVLEPDLTPDTFVFGTNPDGSPRKWKYKPLPWRYEKHFRRQVMPMLAVTYRPFETLLSNLSQPFITEVTPSVVKTMFSAETEIDDYLTKAIHSILIAQDQAVTEEWVDLEAENRDQLFAIIQHQCEIHKIVDRLGESLAERFAKLAQMIGVEIDLPTLKQLWRQVSERLSAQITKLGSIVDSATGLSMDSFSETTSHLPNIPNPDGLPPDALTINLGRKLKAHLRE